MANNLPTWYSENFEAAMVTALGIAAYHGMKCKVSKTKLGDWRVKVIGAGS